MADSGSRKYQDSDFWLDIDNVVIGPEIGKGQFSTVYAGKYFGDLVAVKKQIRKQVTIENYILRELSVLKVAAHENLVQYIGASNNPSTDGTGLSASYIVTELCVGGDLLRLLQNYDVALAWKVRIRIAMQVAGAIRFLHGKNIIHRDIKSSNILLDEDWNCKLSDFGLARFMDQGSSPDNTPAASWSSADLATSYPGSNPEPSIPHNQEKRKLTICGTSEYMPPEMLFDEDYSFSVDIFSFGMVIFEILTRHKIGENNLLVRKPKEKFMLNLDEVTPFLEGQQYPTSMYTLATQCTDYDPSLRPDAEQTLDWIKDVYETDTSDSAVPSPQTTRTQSIRYALSALTSSRDDGRDGVEGLPLGIAGGQTNYNSGKGVFSPQPVAVPKMSFTSPSGVFKSLFHSKTSTSAEGSGLTGIPEVHSSGPGNQLTAVEMLLLEKYLLREPESTLFTPAPSSPSIYDETSSVVLKEGVLYKINETGFRNWKQIHCVLTESRLTWRSNSDPSKTNVFLLKDMTVRRTRDKRFILSHKVTTAIGKTPGKSRANSNAEGGDTRARAPTPDALTPLQPLPGQHQATSRRPSGTSALASFASTAVTDSASNASTTPVPGVASTASCVASSYGNAPSTLLPPAPAPTQTTFVVKELAAKSVEEMDDWIDAIQSAINEQKLGHVIDSEGVQYNSSQPTNESDSHSPRNTSEEFESVADWLRSTGLSESYCSQYQAVLEERGYDSMALILNVGLKDSDFDYLGIDNPAHRRALSNSIRATYSPTLKLNINSYTKFESAVLFKVTTRWHYQRSVIQVQLGHFKRLDRAVRHALHVAHDKHALLQHLPALPSDLHRVRAEGADQQRRLKLELYLMYLAEALEDTPHFVVLLKFLELLP